MASPHEPQPARSDGEDEFEESEEEDDDDDEEEEPKLRYQRLGASIQDLLSRDALSSLAVHEKLLALGTHWGGIVIADFAGNEILRIAKHTGRVTDVSVDLTGEYVGSASDDGRVCVFSLSQAMAAKNPSVHSSSGGAQNLAVTEQSIAAKATVVEYECSRPVMALALDPLFGRKKEQPFVMGGRSGELIMMKKGFFGRKQTVLHAGEGPIFAIAWCGSLIAWANELGVKIYDTNTQSRITYIDRGSNAPRADLYRCHLVWENETTLLIGWGNSIKIGKIMQRHSGSAYPAAVGQTTPHTFTEGQMHAPERYVELTALFQTDYYVCGIAPFGEYLVVLSVDEDTADGEKLRPELRIVTRTKEEISSDALSLHGFEKYSATDYRLCHVEAENMFYVVSPKDLVVGRPRDMDDHVAWLLERRRYDEALRATEAHGDQLRDHTLADVGQSYIEHLLYMSQQPPKDGVDDHANYAQKAAALCPKVLGKNEKLWEQWVFRFGEANEFRAICDYIPTVKPLILSSTVYEMVLGAFLSSYEASDRNKFLELIQSWPPTLYSVPNVITALKRRLQDVSSHEPALMDALARLYAFAGEYDKTLHIYLRLKKKHIPSEHALLGQDLSHGASANGDDAFDLIVRHKLFDAVRDKVMLLLEYDSHRAAELMVTHVDHVPVKHVVDQLVAAGATAPIDPTQDNQGRLPVRRWLHEYLHALFLRDSHAGQDYHKLMIELYADFAPEQLLPFLRQSNYYPLERALTVCESRGLYKETVFLMGRMGNAKKGLQLLIEKIGKVKDAISFIEEQNDKELWDDLIDYAMTSPAFVSDLLEHIGAYVDPLQLIKRIPPHMEISGLRDRLVKIISDYNLQTSLRDGCNRILQSDCADLSLRLFRAQRRGHAVDQFVECALCAGRIVCAKPWSVVVFSCRHVYHQRCLLRALQSDDVVPPQIVGHSMQARAFAMRSSDSLTTEQEDVARSGRLWCTICKNDASKNQDSGARAHSGGLKLGQVVTGRKIGGAR